jgi:putative endonuclease
MPFKVYILFSERANQYYTGNTSQPIEDRLAQHNAGVFHNASTKRGIPWKVFLILECQSREQARQVEDHIKRMKR